MNRTFKILLILSLLINLIFIVLQMKRPPQPRFEIGRDFKIKNLNINNEKQKLLKKLNTIDPELHGKKYVYLTIWDPANYGMYDLPNFDTLIEPKRKDIAYILISAESNAYANLQLRKKKITTNNFLYINGSDSFIHAIYQESKMEDKFKFLCSFPITIIMDKKGHTVYFDTLGFIAQAKDSVGNSNRYFRGINKILNDLE